jgi:membrane-associated phospholipid phosphatase
MVAHRWPSVDLMAPRVPNHRLETLVSRHPRLGGFAQARLNPAAATGLVLSAAIAVLVIATVGFSMLLLMISDNTGLARFDLSGAQFGAHHATALSTQLLRLLTQLGGAVVLVPLAVTVAVIEARRRQPLTVVAFLALTVGGQFLVANLIKTVVDRVRPNIDRLTGFSGPSFPSGHATAAAATLAAFALVMGRQRSVTVRAWLAGVAAGLTVAIAATRVLLGVHWLTDVLAGLALGWAWFAVCSIAFGGRLLQFGAPVAVGAQAFAESPGCRGSHDHENDAGTHQEDHPERSRSPGDARLADTYHPTNRHQGFCCSVRGWHGRRRRYELVERLLGGQLLVQRWKRRITSGRHVGWPGVANYVGVLDSNAGASQPVDQGLGVSRAVLGRRRLVVHGGVVHG